MISRPRAERTLVTADRLTPYQALQMTRWGLRRDPTYKRLLREVAAARSTHEKVVWVGRMKQVFRVFSASEIVADSETLPPDGHPAVLYWSESVPARHPDVVNPDVPCIQLEHVQDLIEVLVDRGRRLLPANPDEDPVSGATPRTRARISRTLQKMGISASRTKGIPQPRKEHPTRADDPVDREKRDRDAAERFARRARERGEIVLSVLPDNRRSDVTLPPEIVVANLRDAVDAGRDRWRGLTETDAAL